MRNTHVSTGGTIMNIKTLSVSFFLPLALSRALSLSFSLWHTENAPMDESTA